MKNSVFLALIILTALLASSCLSFNYYYSDDDPPSPSGVGVILYETKDEADKKEDVKDTLPISDESFPSTDEALQEEIISSETNTEADNGSIQITSLTSPISPNQTATLVAVGKPLTLYKISVYYMTSESTAKGLEPKLSDENGSISWSWRIGASVKAGSYRIVISGGGETIETQIQVAEK